MKLRSFLAAICLLLAAYVPAPAEGINSGVVIGGVEGIFNPSGGAPSFVLPGFTAANDRFCKYSTAQFWPNAAGCALSVTRASAGYANFANGNWASFAAGVARITDLGVKVEEARANVLSQSMALTNAAWTSSTQTATAGQGAPDSTSNAIILVPNVGAGTFNYTNTLGLTLSPTLYTASIFTRPSGYNFFALWIASGAAGSTRYQAVVDSRTCVVTANNTQGVPSGTATQTTLYANGWCRIAVTMLATATAFQSSISFAPTSTGTPTVAANLGPQFTADGTSGALVWQPQLELGSWATTIMPTPALVSRAADMDFFTSTPAFGAAYTEFASGTPDAPTAYGTIQLMVAIDDGTTANRLDVLRNNGNAAATIQLSSSNVQAYLDQVGSVTAPVGSVLKMAQAATAGSQTGAANGSTMSETAAALPIGVNRISVGQESAGYWNGFLDIIGINPTVALSSANLVTITTIAGSCNGTIDLSTGCIQPMLGGL